MSRYVPNEVVKRLKEIRARREIDFHHLGVAVAEYAFNRQKIAAKHEADELHRWVGVLTLEYEGHRETILKRIAESLAEQKRVGEDALEALGLGQERRHFEIDEATAEVRELVNGRYVEVKE